MSIFFWFVIIAVVMLAINIATILHMRKKKSIKNSPVFIILCSGYVVAALLYAITALHGTQILETNQAASLSIETQSYQTVTDGVHSSYAFCSMEGIPFRFDDTALLSTDVPPQPKTVEIYYCKTRTGYALCYLSEGETVRYILK